MSPLLTWRPAVKADRKALPDFVCTDPPKKPEYPREHHRPWELGVQAYARDLRPPVSKQREHLEFILIGERDGKKIGAVSHFDHAGDPCDVFLKIIAVAYDLRKSSEVEKGAYGNELLTQTIEVIKDRARAADSGGEVSISCHIDERNMGSQRLCGDFEFIKLPAPPPGPNLAVWQAVFPL